MSGREQAARDLAEQLRLLAGWSDVGLPPALVPPPGRPASPVRVAPPPAPRSAAVALPAPAAAPASGPLPLDLPGVHEWIGDCQRCKLAKGRRKIVHGQGNPKARLMFVGEAPGADEDVQGLAFVGKAGQLLTKIIEAIGLSRDDVFIANVIKCRPPDNRNPEPDEIIACQPFLERQIEIIAPSVIVGLGKFAGQWLLKSAAPISKLRGRFGEYRGIKVMPTWHPAYLLRNPDAKRDVWEDMKLVRALLAGEPDPGTR